MTATTLLNYERFGSGAPVVLIHGLFGDLDNLKRLGRELESNFELIAIDVRNHGDSFHSDTMSYEAMADDLATLLDDLNIDRTHIVGHSMGGKVAMEFALRHPQRVISLVAADVAPVAYDPKHRHILDALEQLDLTQVENRKDADKLLQKAIDTHGVRQFLLKNLKHADHGYEWRLNLPALDDNYAAISGAVCEGQFDGPILFIKGGDSDYLKPEHESAIRDRFTQVDVKIIEGTSHWLHAEKPRIFNRLVREFLEQQSRAE
ncbi:alpha/beta fold hydrolase [Pseudidiomarina aestuarii]|uniref:alpha/beta fold hydrolase n=1 Tax=Pseudidiomarina aestuarii TaxID=624146 RepID=UPI003A970B8E